MFGVFYISKGKQTKAGSKRKRQGIWKRKRKKRSSRVAILLRPEKPRGERCFRTFECAEEDIEPTIPNLS